MSIGYISKKGKQGSGLGGFAMTFSFIVLGVGIVGALIKLNLQEKAYRPIQFEQNEYIEGDSAGGGYYASKTGTKYFFPWCAGALNIAASKKLFFTTEQTAKADGYQPAGNCAGLK